MFESMQNYIVLDLKSILKSVVNNSEELYFPIHRQKHRKFETPALEMRQRLVDTYVCIINWSRSILSWILIKSDVKLNVSYIWRT